MSKETQKNLVQKLFKRFENHRVLRRKKSKTLEHADLIIAFFREAQAKKLNFRYRKRNYATDVLSFENLGAGEGLGELVLCEKVLRRQAKDHGLPFALELDYMVIHGFLHLLGYDHEKSKKEELKMMRLQDKLFEKFSKK